MKQSFGRARYANVTATIALIIALGGTSYAAVSLPANSVGSAQIKKGGVAASDIKAGAVRSKAVKDGSLLAQDFGPGQLPAGPKGDKGDKGETGVAGADATKLFAHVADNGTLSPVSQGATAAVNNSAGNYTVTFNRDISNCVALAEIGFVPSVGGSFYNDTIARTIIGSGGNVSVYLQRTSTSAGANGNFNVAVFC